MPVESLADGDNHAVKKSNDVLWHLKEATRHLTHEEVWFIPLDKDNKIAQIKTIGRGAIDQSTMDMTAIARDLINDDYSRFIHVHNHPSGDLAPSTMDLQISEAIKEVASNLNKEVDFVITSHKGINLTLSENQHGYTVSEPSKEIERKPVTLSISKPKENGGLER